MIGLLFLLFHFVQDQVKHPIVNEVKKEIMEVQDFLFFGKYTHLEKEKKYVILMVQPNFSLDTFREEGEKLFQKCDVLVIFHLDPPFVFMNEVEYCSPELLKFIEEFKNFFQKFITRYFVGRKKYFLRVFEDKINILEDTADEVYQFLKCVNSSETIFKKVPNDSWNVKFVKDLCYVRYLFSFNKNELYR